MLRALLRRRCSPQPSLVKPKFTCLTGTKVQILTVTCLPVRAAPRPRAFPSPIPPAIRGWGGQETEEEEVVVVMMRRVVEEQKRKRTLRG